MSDELNDELGSVTEPTEEVENTEEIEETTAEVETEDEPKYTETEMKMYARAKKAEAELRKLKAEQAKAQEKPTPAPQVSEKQDAFDLEDVAVLVQKVSHKEDRELVKDYAKFKKVSLEEALQSPVIQAELKAQAEQRATAEATNTGAARRGSAKPSDDAILANASKGKVDDDTDALVNARWNMKLKKE